MRKSHILYFYFSLFDIKTLCMSNNDFYVIFTRHHHLKILFNLLWEAAKKSSSLKGHIMAGPLMPYPTPPLSWHLKFRNVGKKS